MTTDPGIEVEPGMGVAASRLHARGVGAGPVLLIGAWVGLIAGYLDLGGMVLIKRLIERDFYRVGGDFPWLIPAGVMFLVLAPALFIACYAKTRGPVRLGVPVGLLSFLGFLDVSARFRLAMWAAMIISVGLAVQSVRLAGRRPLGFLRLVRWTVGWLAAVLVATLFATVGGRIWSEHRQRTSLPSPAPGAQNVLLVVWDTVRASNTSLYGHGRSTTPYLERLASRGVRFDLAFATAPWTLPSHAGIFTGRWPHEVGVDWRAPLRDDVPTLAEHLAARGYDTAGFAANVDYCSRETGLARGFAHYEDYPLSAFDVFTRYVALGRRLEAAAWTYTVDSLVENGIGRWYDLSAHSREHVKNADAINGAFLGWLGKRSKSGRPFFAFLNYNDAHTPYEVPDPSIPGFGRRPASAFQRRTLQGFTGQDKMKLTDDDVQMANDVYDDCIAYLDRRLNSLLDELNQRGVLENTLVIVTADHGEHLGDHGLFFHGGSLYRQLVQVPLLIVGPKGIPEGRRVAEPVTLAELPATVVDLLGLGPAHPFPGQSVARFWQPRGPETNRVAVKPLLMETTKPVLLTNQGREPAAKGPMKAVVAAGMRYIRMADGSEELYSLTSDVEETVNLARQAGASPVLREFRNLLGLLLKKR